MMRESPSTAAPGGATALAAPENRRGFLATWGWRIGKNVLGWLLILAAMVVGPLVPGPGGIPLFLIGFGLITFPGKRRLTARVLRGVPFERDSTGYRRGAATAALVLPAAAIVYLTVGWGMFRKPTWQTALILAGAYAGGAVLAWILALNSVGLLNWLMRLTPKARRKVRPWLRRRGIDLLPPRRRRRRLSDHANSGMTREPDCEIIEIHQRHRTRLARTWAWGRPWLRRSIGIVITVAIFAWILKPIVKNWPLVRERVMVMNWAQVIAASAMFAGFLFVFRTLTWRRIMRGLGHDLPLAATTRIWSTSELARYLPGVIWQVVGRAYLCKPYGVSGSICSTSQILELAIFLLANLIMAVSCLLFLGWRHLDTLHGLARFWLVAAGALVPVMLVLIHPKIFYRMVNAVMRRLGKPAIEQKLRFRELLGLLGWSVLGLAWQGLAIWLVVHELLGLKAAKWWVVAGAYCLAWCAGFLAVWAPGGLGVREAVFIAAMEFALPRAFRHHTQLQNIEQVNLFLIFLSVLLRIWATAGELMLAAIAYLIDFRGALGSPTASGITGSWTRARQAQPAEPPEPSEPAAMSARVHADRPS